VSVEKRVVDIHYILSMLHDEMGVKSDQVGNAYISTYLE